MTRLRPSWPFWKPRIGLADLLEKCDVPANSRVLWINGRDASWSARRRLMRPGWQVDVAGMGAPVTARMKSTLKRDDKKRFRFVDDAHHLSDDTYDLILVTVGAKQRKTIISDTPWLARRLSLHGVLVLEGKGAGPAGQGFPSFEPGHASPGDAGPGVFARACALTVIGQEVDPWRTRWRMALGRGQEAGATEPNDYLESVERTLQEAPFFLAPGNRRLTGCLPEPSGASDLKALLADKPFDTVMFVHNRFSTDPRVERTARAVTEAGRTVLAVGVGAGEAFELDVLGDGTPLVRLPYLIPRFGRRAALERHALGPAERFELRMAHAGSILGWLLTHLDGRDIVLHTHDFLGMYAGGMAMAAARDARRRPLRWVHDVHEKVVGYGIIAPEVEALAVRWEQAYISQPDVVTTVSDELAHHLMTTYDLVRKPDVIYSAVEEREELPSDTPDIRSRFGIGDQPIIIHPGSLREGRGAEHVISALPHLPGHHFVMISGSENAYVESLKTLASSLGVTQRVHFHPHVPASLLTALCETADVGVIAADHYGNADVSMPNKLFVYIAARLPVVTTDTGSLRRLLSEWPIGVVTPCGDSMGMARSIREATTNKHVFLATLDGDEARRRAFTWRAQKEKLAAIYKAIG